MTNIIINQINEATDNNQHTEAVMIAARALGGVIGGAYLVILQEIDDMHELSGEISEDHQQLRRFIEKDIHKFLKAMGKI